MTDHAPSVPTNQIILLGLHREEDGSIVFTDPNGNERAARTAEGLRKAILEILDDASLPRTEVPAADSAAAAGIVGIAQKELEEHATREYGAVVGKLVGVLGGKGAQRVVQFMQRNSRK